MILRPGPGTCLTSITPMFGICQCLGNIELHIISIPQPMRSQQLITKLDGILLATTLPTLQQTDHHRHGIGTVVVEARCQKNLSTNSSRKSININNKSHLGLLRDLPPSSNRIVWSGSNPSIFIITITLTSSNNPPINLSNMNKPRPITTVSMAFLINRVRTVSSTHPLQAVFQPDFSRKDITTRYWPTTLARTTKGSSLFSLGKTPIGLVHPVCFRIGTRNLLHWRHHQDCRL